MVCFRKFSFVLSLSLFLIVVACVSNHKADRSSALDPMVKIPAAEGPDAEIPVDAVPFRSMGLMESVRGPAASRPELPQAYKAGQVFSTITDPVLLRAIESEGFGLGRHFGLNGRVLPNKELALNSGYRSIMEVLDSDLKELLQSEKRFSSSVGVGIDHERRIFDIEWMRSKIAEYQLIGVINRLDRVAFDNDSCGELRFIYRLAYRHPSAQSRLPMTILVMYKVEKRENWQSCSRMVANWTYPEVRGDFQRLVSWMTSQQGPLATEFVRPEFLNAVEINMQALRIPSSIRPDIGSHAEYLMRVFKPAGDRFEPKTLENTPDVERIKADPQLLASFKALMKDRHVARRIDNGIFQLDEQYLAKRAYSYSPMGLERQDNRMYTQLLAPGDFNPAHFTSNNRFVRTPEAAIRRLNDLSCVGCHQGRATAGFHFLGIDRPETHYMNALKFEGSGHFQLELIRRQAYLERMARHLVPDPGRDFSYAPPMKQSREISLQPDYLPAEINHFCGMPGSKAFGMWKCAHGLKCRRYEGVEGEMELGKCSAESMPAGSACQAGTMTQADHHSDTLMLDASQKTCGNGNRGYRCSPLKGGFPSGSCSRPCQDLNGFETCGSAPGQNFSRCLGQQRPIDVCYEDAIPSVRGKCNEKLSCRNDYVCERSRRGSDGYCTPTYSMGQIRLDGHPSPD